MRVNPHNAAVVATALFLMGIGVLFLACNSTGESRYDVVVPVEMAFRDDIVTREELTSLLRASHADHMRFVRSLIIWPAACFMGSAALLFLARQENLRAKRESGRDRTPHR